MYFENLHRILISSFLFLNSCGILARGYSQTAYAAGWSEAGIPVIRNFRPADYDAGPLNYVITQDSLGVIYIANESGVLVFDGVQWDLIRLPENSAAHSLCYSNGKIYVGGYNHLGYLQSDSLGKWTFVSLNRFIPDTLRQYKSIGDVVAIGDTVFFRSYYALFIWDGKSMRVFKPRTVFFNAFVVDNAFFISEWKVGLKRLTDNKLQMIPRGDYFATKIVAGMLPRSGHLEIITRFDGRFLLDEQGLHRLPIHSEAFWQNSLIYRTQLLPNGYLALATHRRGLAIADNNGHILQVLGRDVGLRDHTVNFIHRDRQGGLWLALSNGLARVEIPAPYSYFGYTTGLDGAILSVIRHQKELFVGSNLGVYRLLSREGDSPARFRIIPGVRSAAYDLASHRGTLYIASHRGLYKLVDEVAKLIPSDGASATAVCPSRIFSDRLISGDYRDIRLFRILKSGSEQFQGILHPVGNVSDIIEADDGAIWVSSRNGVYRILLDAYGNAPDIVHIDSLDGFPLRSPIIRVIGGKVSLLIGTAIYQWDLHSRQFRKAISPDKNLIDERTVISEMALDDAGGIWLAGSRGNSPFCQRWDTQFSEVLDSIPTYRLQPIGQIRVIYPEPDGVVWIGGSDGLLRYQPALRFTTPPSFSVVIRNVVIEDSLQISGSPRINSKSDSSMNIRYATNTLRFSFAAPYFRSPETVRYRSYLEGYEKSWSQWRRETYRDYTGLPPGFYRFKVQAINGDGMMSNTAEFAFRILPPWYMSRWAYAAYGILGILLIFALMQWRVHRLQQKTRELEAVVAERTATIRQQAQQLAELDKMKSRFLANISHEFRTPLTLLLGPLEDWLSGKVASNHPETWRLMHRAARRLLNLVNQLLDLSRLEAGKLTLSVSRGNFYQFLKGMVMAFASMAEQKGIQLIFSTDGAESALQTAYFDKEKMETIISNLLSNALKFTPKGGEVKVTCRIIERTQSSQPDSQLWVEVQVQDNGAGIPPSALPHIFERFYHGDGAGHRAADGVGIGLAMVKELTELHHGEIDVVSFPQHGTTFTLRFPLHREAYQPDEIVADVPTADDFTFTTNFDDATAAAVNEPQTPKGNSRKPLVLIVEDHPDVRRYLQQQLQSDFRVVEAADGETALQQATRYMPDLIISDVMMPGIDGCELCEKIKSDIRTSHIPVILLTAKAGEESKISGLETGADDYLTKPFNARELLVRVRNLIEQRRRLQERYRREGLLQPSDTDLPSVEKRFLRKLVEVTEAGAAQEEFGPQQLSKAMGMSRRTLQRKIRALTGQTPSDFIRSVRLRKAKQLLEKGAGNVSEICFQVGFENLPYFTRSFKQEFGVTPSEVLKKR
jgi:signal transduction histidine kinase/DNA-binding response OmpR family regulator